MIPKLIFSLLLVASVLSAQTIQLRGKIIDINKQPINNITIRFSSFGEILTTGSGEFVISIPDDVKIVDISLREPGWQILFPVDFKIPVPADQFFVNTVIATKENPEDGMSVNESMNKYSELEDLLKEFGSTNEELKSFFSKFIELEAKRLEISEMKLKEEFEKKNQRNKIYSNISPVLNEYILRIKNLKTNFEMYYEQSFVSNTSVEHLNKAIKFYNPVFDTINNNYRYWQNLINASWDENLSENFAASINYMIDEIHKPYIFQLNQEIVLINNVRLRIGDGATRPDELKNEIIEDVNNILEKLDIKIPILEDRFKEINTRLQHSGFD